LAFDRRLPMQNRQRFDQSRYRLRTRTGDVKL